MPGNVAVASERTRKSSRLPDRAARNVTSPPAPSKCKTARGTQPPAPTRVLPSKVTTLTPAGIWAVTATLVPSRRMEEIVGPFSVAAAEAGALAAPAVPTIAFTAAAINNASDK